MDIKILDSWLREYLRSSATPKQIATELSLRSVAVDRLTLFESDVIYEIEVTQNRPDLMSVVELAHEAAAVLTEAGITAEFVPSKSTIPTKSANHISEIEILSDPKLVRRICAAVLEVELKESPKYIQKRLEASGIRSLNNIIDVTNYVMREIGHPTHVFDYDRLTAKKLIIRESKKGEKITTLDDKTYTLEGGDIVADDGNGEIVDLLGVMGTKNSVVTNNTRRILFFIDTVEPSHIRKTSMSLGVRTDASVLNEKGIDPELGMKALTRGINLYKKIARGKLLSPILDMYSDKPKTHTVSVTEEKINAVIGVKIPISQSFQILEKLGFKTSIENNTIEATVPTARINDIIIPEDLIEEIARVYGYHKIPVALPTIQPSERYQIENNQFYWMSRIRNAMKYWGFSEIYTYSLISEKLHEGPLEEAVTIANPLNEELMYMRKSLIPSLLQAIDENKNRQELKIFEIANVYHKRKNDLPQELLMFGVAIKKQSVSFFEAKGLVEQLLMDMNIQDIIFKPTEYATEGADVYIKKEYVGTIEVFDVSIINIELNFQLLLKYANVKKVYKGLPKFPPVIEDIRLEISDTVTYENIVNLIKKQNKLIASVELLDAYKNKKTFRIYYQDPEKNLTNEEVKPIREKIIKSLEKELNVKVV